MKTPKFKINDKVAEKDRGLAIKRPNQKFRKEYEIPLREGVVINCTTKKNKVGSAYFYYDVLWNGSKKPQEVAQLRLKPITQEN